MLTPCQFLWSIVYLTCCYQYIDCIQSNNSNLFLFTIVCISFSLEIRQTRRKFHKNLFISIAGNSLPLQFCRQESAQWSQSLIGLIPFQFFVYIWIFYLSSSIYWLASSQLYRALPFVSFYVILMSWRQSTWMTLHKKIIYKHHRQQSVSSVV